MASINESIAALEAYYKAQQANITREQLLEKMTVAEREQYLLLTLIRDTYEQIVDMDQMREYRLKNIKELQKEISDIFKLQESLSALQVEDTGFIALLDRIIELKRQAATMSLKTQLGEDINNLKEFIDSKTFAFDPDSDLDAASAAIEGTIATLTELISLQTEQYKQQEKVIKERYKTETEAIKEAHDEKWSEIDYTNELAEAEENLILARRQLEGLAISNASRGQLEEAQKNLEKLRQERDKIIEERMLEEAQKQLEIDMQDELTDELEGLNSSIESYTKTLANLITTIFAINPSYVPPATGGAGGGSNTGTNIAGPGPNITIAEMAAKFDPLTEGLTNLSTKTTATITATEELTSTSLLLKTSIDGLRGTIQDWSVRIVNTSGTSESGDVEGNSP
jgi:hypothetical protein